MIAAKPLRRSRFTAVVNPQKKRARKAAAKPAARRKIRKSSGAPRRNPSTILLGYLNPEKKTVMKHKKTKKIRRAKRNPIVAKVFTHRRKNGRPRRRNPLSNTIVSKPVQLLKAGAIGAIAYFATRQVPQVVLKSRNTGWMGYFANLLTALACAAGADKYFGPSAGQSAFVGGGMYVFSRILNDNTSYGATLNLSGVGDPAAVKGLRGLVPGYFTHPAITTRAGEAVPSQFQPVIDAAVQTVAKTQAPVAAAGVSGGRFASRF